MPGLQLTDLQSRPSEFLNVTSLPLDEFSQLVLPFEAAFPTPRTAWQFDGKPRTARQLTLYPRCKG